MQIAVLTFDGFNELDSFVAAAILNRMKPHGWAAHITSPTEQVTSMNGITVQRQKPLEFASEADAVLIGSGIKTREIAVDANLPACTDLTTKPWVIEAGVEVIDAPFVAHGNVATAGGCLASQYLATWIIARGASMRAAEEAIHYVAPVGEKALYVDRAVSVVAPFIPQESAIAA